MPFCPYHFVQCHFVRIPFCPLPFCPRTHLKHAQKCWVWKGLKEFSPNKTSSVVKRGPYSEPLGSECSIWKYVGHFTSSLATLCCQHLVGLNGLWVEIILHWIQSDRIVLLQIITMTKKKNTKRKNKVITSQVSSWISQDHWWCISPT